MKDVAVKEEAEGLCDGPRICIGQSQGGLVVLLYKDGANERHERLEGNEKGVYALEKNFHV